MSQGKSYLSPNLTLTRISTNTEMTPMFSDCLPGQQEKRPFPQAIKHHQEIPALLAVTMGHQCMIDNSKLGSLKRMLKDDREQAGISISLETLLMVNTDTVLRLQKVYFCSRVLKFPPSHQFLLLSGNVILCYCQRNYVRVYGPLWSPYLGQV